LRRDRLDLECDATGVIRQGICSRSEEVDVTQKTLCQPGGD